jgi:hypothetical protein
MNTLLGKFRKMSRPVSNSIVTLSLIGVILQGVSHLLKGDILYRNWFNQPIQPVMVVTACSLGIIFLWLEPLITKNKGKRRKRRRR